MQEIKYFGNLINEKVKPVPLKEFKEKAIPQQKWKAEGYMLYILDNKYAVARLKGSKILDYCIVGDVDDYRELYTNNKSSESKCRQALYHGVCLLTRRKRKTIGLGYDV